MQDQAPQQLTSSANHAPVTERVNVEPPILNGMASTEAMYIGMASAAISIFLAGVLQVFTGWGIVLIILVVVLPLLTLWYGSLYLMHVKRNKPDGFYVQMIHLYLVSKNYTKSKFIAHRGFWDIGR
ncbi:TIGR03750 family conjugal transfer protein [Comamonas sp.]|uniref:TIGR03750 family conjugal transfer protein n=1 Tax=Comamonas sp. TaxID=34028 RepID=UPI0025858177|nr:TIGR03750 family conjugal transfer protein [Comamonas sp.]